MVRKCSLLALFSGQPTLCPLGAGARGDQGDPPPLAVCGMKVSLARRRKDFERDNPRLLANAAESSISRSKARGKLISPSRRRACVGAACRKLAVSERSACAAATAGMAIGASPHCCAGRAGRLNAKPVERIWRREGLKVPQRRPKCGQTVAGRRSCIRLRPERRNHIAATTLSRTGGTRDGRSALRVIDEFTRECRTIAVARRLNSADVLDTLAGLFAPRAAGAYPLRNGPEFAAIAVREWVARLSVGTMFNRARQLVGERL